jgi:hypothetical protein
MPDYQAAGSAPHSFRAECEFLMQANPTFLRNRGFASVARTGVGDYTLTLEFGTAAAGEGIYTQVIGTTARFAVVERVSGVSLRVRCFSDAGAAADGTSCQLFLTRIGVGS